MSASGKRSPAASASAIEVSEVGHLRRSADCVTPLAAAERRSATDLCRGLSRAQWIDENMSTFGADAGCCVTRCRRPTVSGPVNSTRHDAPCRRTAARSSCSRASSTCCAIWSGIGNASSPKDELLDALWPGTVVVDNALQRVVSLARSALAEVGLSDAVRTYCAPWLSLLHRRLRRGGCPAAAADPSGSVAEARAACDRNDWVAASEVYAAADALSPLSPDDVEQWGRAAICAGLGPTAVSALERAVARRDADGDALGAARATLLLVQIRIDHKQGVMARGLLQRASRYLDGKSSVIERGHSRMAGQPNGPRRRRCRGGAGDGRRSVQARTRVARPRRGMSRSGVPGPCIDGAGR